MASSPSADGLAAHLLALHDRFRFERSLAQDPLGEVRRLARTPADRELIGLFASLVAVGQTAAIRRTVRRLVDGASGDVAGFVRDGGRSAHRAAWGGIHHRWIRGDQLVHLADRLAEILPSFGSLEPIVAEGLADGGFAHGIDALARALRGDGGGGGAPRGYALLFPSPLDPTHSPAKRLTLFLRWMVRTGFPDLGLWRSIPARELRIPLDQHVHWIAYHTGLTRRRSRTWATVEEITASLRRIDPDDPVRFDFVLCHTGISGDCPKERRAEACAPCALRPDCLLWRPRRRAG
ncbi:MAG: DUF2400 family protein [Thermoplasmata archaeon]